MTVTIGGSNCPIDGPSLTYCKIICTAPALAASASRPITVTSGEFGIVVTAGVVYASHGASVPSPSIGPLNGGTSITMTNTGATAVLGQTSSDVTVSIGGVACTVTSASSSRVVCTTLAAPGLVAGPYNIIASSTIFGSSTLNAAFTYIRSTISAIQPTSGPLVGRNLITVSSSDVLGDVGSDVTLFVGGVACPLTAGQTTSQAICVAPHGAAAGAATISVSSVLYGTNTFSSYIYVAQHVAGVSPAVGPKIGGNQVTVTSTPASGVLGSSVAGDISIFLNGIACPVVPTAVSSSSVVCTAPSSAVAGLVSVNVSSLTYGWTQVASAYTYVAQGVPVITPTSGPFIGGNSVTITVAGSTVLGAVNSGVADFTIKLGSKACPIVGTPGTTTAICTAPSGTGSPTSVVITVSSALYGTTPSATAVYTYISQVISAIDPIAGVQAGNNAITITAVAPAVLGAGGSDITAVLLGTVPCTITQQTTLTVTCTAGSSLAATAVQVKVQSTVYGQATFDSYTFLDASSYVVDPSRGPSRGGNLITVSGTFPPSLSAITIGGQAVTFAFVGVSTTTLTLTSPAHTAQPVDMTFPAGGATTTMTGAYTYVDNAISSISPTSGPLVGGTSLTLTAIDPLVLGSLVANDMTVTVGTHVCVIQGVPSVSSLVCSTPAGDTAAAVTVALVSNDYGNVLSATQFTYIAQTVATVQPNSGPLIGGTVITVSSSGAAQLGSIDVGDYAIFINSVLCPLTAFVPTTSRCQCTTPAGVVANVNYNVTVMSLTFGRADLPSGFHYIAQSIDAVSPSVGPLLGGNWVTITATPPSQLSAGDVTAVTVGGTAVLQIGAQSTTSVVVQMPPDAASDLEDIIVTSTSFGSTTAANAYRYASSIDYTFTPNSGPTLGQTTVTLVGPAMSIGTANDIASAKFGGVTATIVSQSATMVTLTTPAFNTAGAVSVVLTATSGIVTTIVGRFSYVGAAIDGISPTVGAERGGTTVTITSTGAAVLGSGTDITAVLFGSVPVQQIVSQSAVQVVVVTAAGTGTDVAVTVTSTSFGNSVLANAFSFIHQSIDVILPASGPAIGGNTVTLQANNPSVLGSVVANDMSITVNNVACVVASLPAPSQQQIVCTVPDSNLVFGDVLVRLTSVEFGIVTKTYTYVQQVIGSVLPVRGPRIGGATVTVSAAALAALGAVSPVDYTVSFGASTCVLDGATVPTTTRFICTTPPGAADGSVAITVVSTSYGTAQLAAAYEYVSPSITAVVPTNGPIGGQNTVTITSSDVLGGGNDIDLVKFGSVSSTSIVSQTASRVVVLAPAQAAGSVTISVHSTSYGDASLATAYTYAANAAYAVTPNTGPGVGGTTVTISGVTLSDSSDVNSVTIGGVAVRSIVSGQTTTSVTVVTNGGPGGAKDIVLTSASGVVSSIVGGFSYVAQDVAAVTPISGAMQGGTNITISSSVGAVLGDGSDITSVTIGGRTALVITQSTSVVVVMTPAGVTPHVAVSIAVSSTLYGQGVLNSAFTYVAHGADVLVPVAGPALGGNTITITANSPAQIGSGVTGDVSVSIGALPCGNVLATTVSVTCEVPQNAAGLYSITVVSQAFGVITVSQQYQYIAMSIATVVPAAGPVGGQNLVTVTASANAALGNGNDITAVKFGSADAVALSAQTTSSIVAQVPAGTGYVAVTVLSTSYGTATKAAAYHYAVNSDYVVTPASGPAIGGAIVIITGPALSNGASNDITSVTIGGVQVTAIGSQSASAVTVTTAASSAGSKDIVLLGASSISTTITGKYLYIAQAITSIVPSSGPQRTIDITISATAPAVLGASDVAVTFGGVAATVVSQTATEVVVRPVTAAAAGTVTVSVVSAVFGSSTTSYTFIAQVVGSISPAFGPKRGLNTLLITSDVGNNAVLGTASDVSVTIGTLTCAVTGTPTTTAFSCIVPAGALAQAYTVTVTSTLYGTVTAPTQYTYIDQVIDSVTPSIGPSIGGAKVTIKALPPAQVGAGDVSSITIGSIPCDVETSPAQSTTQVVCITRSSGVLNTALAVTIVSTTFGNAEKTLAYSYVPMAFGAINPATGPLTGGNVVTITAAANAAFGGDVTEVSFGAVVVTNLAGATQTLTSIVMEVPSTATPAAVIITVSSPSYGSTASASAVYTYVSASSYSVTPPYGPTLGGTVVTISGPGGFGTFSSVKLNGVAATAITPGATTTTVTVTSAAAAAGQGDVEILGSVSFTIPSAWTYYALAVGNVVPNEGPLRGGNIVTINAQPGARLGSGVLSDITAVKIDNVACAVQSVSSTAIVCQTAAHTVPDVAYGVTVQSVTYGSGTTPSLYTYIEQTIGTTTPASGPLIGGTVVTIASAVAGRLGDGADIVSVLFGTLSASLSGAVQTTSNIVLNAPAATNGGLVQLTIVSTSYGTVIGSSYSYLAASIGTATPTNGPLVGANAVTIIGTNFDSISAVSICGVAASVTGPTSSSVTVTAGSGVGHAGACVVSVTTASFGVATLNAGYTYNVAGAISTALPLSIPLLGGVTVTVTGTNLGNGGDITSVSLNGVPVTSIGLQSSTSVTVVAAGGSAGTGAIVLASTSFGTSTSGSIFTYVAGSVTSVIPTNGALAGGTRVTLIGSNLGSGSDIASVLFGGLSASLVSQTASSVIVTTPAGAGPGLVTVVINSGSFGSTSSTNAYRFNVAGVVSGISPIRGALGGGTLVTVSGTDLGSGTDITSVTLNGVAAQLGAQSATAVTVTVAAGTVVGLGDVIVTSTSFGVSSLASAFTYETVNVTSVVPAVGPGHGGNTVTISGTVLGTGTDITSVTFNGVSAVILTQSITTVTVTLGNAVAANALGLGDVVVQSTHYLTGMLSNAYRYNNPLVISSLVPPDGPVGGNSVITINGNNMGDGADVTSVTLAGVPVAAIIGQSANTVTIQTASGVGHEGTGDVVMQSTSFGVGSRSNGFTYLVGVVTAVTPPVGPLVGGNHVTISGQRLGLGADISMVTVCGLSVDIINQTASSVTVVAAAGVSAGAGDVKVQSPSFLTLQAIAAYTYNVAPAIVSVTPTHLPLYGGVAVTIAGTLGDGFDISTVLLSGVVPTNILGQTASSITVTAASGASVPGAGAVFVDSVSFGNVTANNAITYVAPVITTVSPSACSHFGCIVTITGSPLGNGVDITSVTLRDVPALILSQTAFTVTVRAGNGTGYIGLGDAVTSSISYGPATSVDSFSYFCALGTYGSAATGQLCLPCPPGQFSGLAGSLSCLPCGPGSYNPNSEAFICEACPKGHYCDASGLDSAEPCPAGTYSNMSGADSNSTCVPCDAGWFSSEQASTICSSCVAGSISAVGSTTCTNCTAGASSNVDNTQCEDCSTGWYGPFSGALCMKCAGGSFSNVTGQTVCSTCEAGSKSLAGASTCTACLSGQWSATGATACTNCSGGTYSSQSASSCRNCTAGRFAPEGSAMCSNCTAGSFSADRAENCTLCPAGTYCASPATVLPTNCTANTSNPSTGSTSATACRLCTNGYTSYPGAADCHVPVQSGISDNPTHRSDDPLLSPAVGAGIGVGAAVIAAAIATLVYCTIRGGLCACKRRRPDRRDDLTAAEQWLATTPGAAASMHSEVTPQMLAAARIAWSDDEVARVQQNPIANSTGSSESSRSDDDGKWEGVPDDRVPHSPSSTGPFDEGLYEKVIDFRQLLNSRRQSRIPLHLREQLANLLAKLPSSRHGSRATLDLRDIAATTAIPPQSIQVAAATLPSVPELEHEHLFAPINPSDESLATAAAIDLARVTRLLHRASGVLDRAGQKPVLPSIRPRQQPPVTDVANTEASTAVVVTEQVSGEGTAKVTEKATPAQQPKTKDPRDELREAIEAIGSPHQTAPKLVPLSELRDRLATLRRVASPPNTPAANDAEIPPLVLPPFVHKTWTAPALAPIARHGGSTADGAVDAVDAPRSPSDIHSIRQVQSRLRDLRERIPSVTSGTLPDIGEAAQHRLLKQFELPPVHLPRFSPLLTPLPQSPHLTASPSVETGLSSMSLNGSVAPSRSVSPVTQHDDTDYYETASPTSAVEDETVSLEALSDVVRKSALPRNSSTRASGLSQLPPPPAPTPKLFSTGKRSQSKQP
eukprot:TRINITY_DN4392_c0_g3_i2.p1 TRINITY_DN4392_c0_g3~~TRINITY_DN4392_c0_g3_i2.p1  ORF type:complete len:4249 (-),score=1037.24 TRINITY_DN4392_c0_g3_i2:134-12388(-)